MKTKLLILPFLLFIGLFTSCSNLKNFHNNKARGKAGIVRIPQYQSVSNSRTDVSEQSQDSGTFLWSYYDATQRGSVMYVKDGKIRVLAENSPDAAIQSITDISAKISGLSGDIGEAEAAFNTQRAIAQLAKRTAAVNMLRDALYRLNEMYYATVDEKDAVRKLLINKEIDSSIYKILSEEDAKSNKTLSEDKLVCLFEKIIEKAKEISVEENVTEREVSKSESLSNVEKYKAETKKAELEIKEYEALLLIIQKREGNLTKEEADEYLKKFIKQQK